MVQIIWLPSAKADLQNIYQYIAIDSRKYAKHQVTKIREKTKVLLQYPHLGKIVPELQDETTRELIEGNYRIIYKISDESIIKILMIHHSARLLSQRL
jgi:toxin ParE1/3/4